MRNGKQIRLSRMLYALHEIKSFITTSKGPATVKHPNPF